MAASTSLTTVAKVRTYINKSDADETLLTALIASASEVIERWCNRRFAQESVTDYMDGKGEPFVVLSQPPVDTDQTVQVWDDPGRDYESGDLVDSDDYAVDADAGTITLDGGTFADGNRNVKASYTGGFASVPPAVEQAANMLVASWYNMGQSGADGIKAESLGRHSITYKDDEGMTIPGAVKIILGSYRRIRL